MRSTHHCRGLLCLFILLLLSAQWVTVIAVNHDQGPPRTSNIERHRTIDSCERWIEDSLHSVYQVPMYRITDYFSGGEVRATAYSFWKVKNRWYVAKRWYFDFVVCDRIRHGQSKEQLIYWLSKNPSVVSKKSYKLVLERAGRVWRKYGVHTDCVRDSSDVNARCIFLKIPVLAIGYKHQINDVTGFTRCIRRRFDNSQYEEHLLWVLRKIPIRAS